LPAGEALPTRGDDRRRKPLGGYEIRPKSFGAVL